jgi:hypothetical protein
MTNFSYDIMACKYWIAFINLQPFSEHWVLGLWRLECRTVTVYDSLLRVVGDDGKHHAGLTVRPSGQHPTACSGLYVCTVGIFY